MGIHVFIVATVLFILIISYQLIRFASLILLLRKDKQLVEATSKLEKEWEFIKGLY